MAPFKGRFNSKSLKVKTCSQEPLFLKRFCLKKLSCASAVLLLLGSCGSNSFELVDEADPAEKGAVLLERKEETAAINLLTKEVLSSDDPKAWSVLSAAYAQRGGIEPLTMAQTLAGGTSQSSLIGMFSYVPRATQDRVSDLKVSVSILTNDLTRGRWLPGDDFKFAIYQTASMIYNLKILDTNEDGGLSTEELFNIQNATSTVGQLASAVSVLATASDPTSQKAAEKLAVYSNAIQASPGSTDDEKLRNYLGKQ